MRKSIIVLMLLVLWTGISLAGSGRLGHAQIIVTANSDSVTADDGMRNEGALLNKGAGTFRGILTVEDSTLGQGLRLELGALIKGAATVRGNFVKNATTWNIAGGDSIEGAIISKRTVPNDALAAMTSAQLAAIISNETGTGLLPLATAPTFTGLVTISTSGSTGGLLIDGNKTTGYLAQFSNDDDGTPADSSLSITKNGSILIGNGTAADQVVPTFSLTYDADSDASATTNETFTMTPTGTATPTNSYILFGLTQGLGYKFDRNVGIGTVPSASALDVTKSNAGTSIAYLMNSAANGYGVALGTAATSNTYYALNVLGGTTTSIMKWYADGTIGVGGAASMANSVAFGTKANQRDVVVTRENVAAGTDSASVLSANGGFGSLALLNGAGDKLKYCGIQAATYAATSGDLWLSRNGGTTPRDTLWIKVTADTSAYVVFTARAKSH